MPPTFWQFVRERWARILLGTVAWTAACAVVNAYCPPWIRWLWNSLAWCWLSYHWGAVRERERCSKALLASRELHCADLDRFVVYLAEQRRYVDQMAAIVDQDDRPKGQAN
jgi:hypothetical protein